MSRILALSPSNPIEIGERKRNTKTKPFPLSGSRVTLNFLLVVLICAAGVLYIFEVNDRATLGYQIKQKEQKIQDLKDQNEKLKIREAELRSMYNIEEKTKELNMTAPQNVSYMSLPGNVAMK
jgi:cell division protein FtsL